MRITEQNWHTLTKMEIVCKCQHVFSTMTQHFSLTMVFQSANTITKALIKMTHPHGQTFFTENIVNIFSYTSKNIDCSWAPCLLHQYCQWLQQQKKKRKEEAYPWKAGSGSGHITNLKQSILETFDIYGMSQQFCEITSSPKII